MIDSKHARWRKSSHRSGDGNCVEVASSNWRKSTYSNSSSNCVEVATTERVVGVRDSKQHGRGPVLEFTADEWAAFLRAVKSGEFDL